MHTDDRHPLRRWRETREPPLSQDEAGRALEVPGNTFARWERGESIPQKRHRLRIFEVCGISERELLAAYGGQPAGAVA